MNFAVPQDPRRAQSPGDFKDPFAAGPRGRKSAPRAAHLDHFEVAAHNQELNAKLDKAQYLLAVEQNACRVSSKDDKALSDQARLALKAHNDRAVLDSHAAQAEAKGLQLEAKRAADSLKRPWATYQAQQHAFDTWDGGTAAGLQAQ